jgi:predicted MPP superfamily phosphohydrolase
MTGNIADRPLPAQKPIAAETSLLTRRSFLLGSAAGAAGGLALYSGEFARHEISILTRTIALANLPEAFHNYRIAQISDIHFDEYTEPSFVRRVVARVNTLAPDLVLLTGDFISDSPLSANFAYHAIFRCTEILRGITCPLRYAVMGNHDSVLGAPIVREALASAFIPLLVDQHLPIERDGKRLWLAGTDEPIHHFPNLDRAIPERPDGPVLLMCHGPDYADVVVAHPRGHLVDLMLSGHTHGGQIRFPIVGALHLPEGGTKYVEGLFHLDRMQLYVNRGIGTVGVPFRLNCPPEITLLTLRRA